ncbi:MAG: flippase-like domain-containing protein, partial [Solirubrobacterales bacterium]|nr:flippase-like domain-containing protein [Solirubrobacterales bacterium]
MSAGRSARPLLLAVGLVVTVGAIALAMRGVALDDSADALAASNLLWLIPSTAVFVAGVGLRALRWWTLFHVEQRPSLREVTRALLVGYFFNNILPARAGEVARVITLHARTRTPRAETIGTVVAERVFDVLALLIILFAAYPWLPPLSWLRAAAIFGVVIVLAIGALVFVIVRYDERAIHWLLSPLRRVRRDGFAKRVELAAINATRGLVAIRSPRVAFESLMLTILSWVVLSFSSWLLMQGFSLDVAFAAGLLVTVTINMGLVLPSAPAAIGVFEAAVVIALNVFDVPQAEALSYALVLHLLNLIPFLLAGAA